MCGIIGYIGRSKNPNLTYELTNQLLLKTESRGTDATGFWGAELGTDGKIIYDKEAIKSTEYVKGEYWKLFKEINADLFLGHCRQSTISGSEKTNRNNHPHTSEDRTVAMVHNGKISEYHALKEKYPHKTECDSEILLRMFEHSERLTKSEDELTKEFQNVPTRIAWRLKGIKEIFSRINFDHAMAVALAERHQDGGRTLWLFRDEKRPLCVIDLREQLGQIFFCSTPDIFRGAYEDSPLAKRTINQSQKILEIPTYQVWYLHQDPRGNIGFLKIKIVKDKNPKEQVEEPVLSTAQKRNESQVKVITRLNENEEIEKKNDLTIIPRTNPIAPVNNFTHDSAKGYGKTHTNKTNHAGPGVKKNELDRFSDDGNSLEDSEEWIQGWKSNRQVAQKIGCDQLEQACERMKEVVSEIKTQAENLISTGELSVADFYGLLEEMTRSTGGFVQYCDDSDWEIPKIVKTSSVSVGKLDVISDFIEKTVTRIYARALTFESLDEVVTEIKQAIMDIESLKFMYLKGG